jgi:hypothetical protein
MAQVNSLIIKHYKNGLCNYDIYSKKRILFRILKSVL